MNHLHTTEMTQEIFWVGVGRSHWSINGWFGIEGREGKN